VKLVPPKRAAVYDPHLIIDDSSVVEQRTQSPKIEAEAVSHLAATRWSKRAGATRGSSPSGGAIPVLHEGTLTHQQGQATGAEEKMRL
jgi:hypothetical protein